jgi:hypothetical protein
LIIFFSGGILSHTREITIKHEHMIEDKSLIGVGISSFFTTQLGFGKSYGTEVTVGNETTSQTTASCLQHDGYFATLMFYPYMVNYEGKIYPYGKSFYLLNRNYVLIKQHIVVQNIFSHESYCLPPSELKAKVSAKGFKGHSAGISQCCYTDHIPRGPIPQKDCISKPLTSSNKKDSCLKMH